MDIEFDILVYPNYMGEIETFYKKQKFEKKQKSFRRKNRFFGNFSLALATELFALSCLAAYCCFPCGARTTTPPVADSRTLGYSFHPQQETNLLKPARISHPGTQEVLVLAQGKTKRKTEQYNALLGVGLSLQQKDSTSFTPPPDLLEHGTRLETGLEQLFQTMETAYITPQDQKDHSDILVDSATYFRKNLVQGVGFHREFEQIEDFVFENPRRSTLSGLIAITHDGRRLPITKERLQNWFRLDPFQRGQETQETIDQFLRFKQRFDTKVQNQERFEAVQTAVRESSNQMLESLRQQPQEPIYSPQLNKNFFVFQIYSKPIRFLGLNGSFSGDFKTKQFSIGLGKAYFRPLSNKNVGIIFGLDASARFRPSESALFNHRYSGIGMTGFLGLGVRV